VSPTARASAAYVCLFAAVGASFPYLPVYYQGLGIGLGLIGTLTALMALTGLLAAPLWGVVADRFAGSPLILPACAAVASLGALILAFAPSVPAVLLGVLVFAGGSSGIASTLDARALEVVGEDRDRYGRLRVWGSISFIVSSAAVGTLIERGGAHSIFLVWIPALLLTGLVAYSLPGAHQHVRLARLEGLRQVLTEPGIVRFLVAALLVWSANTAVNAFFSIHLLGLGAPASLVGTAWALGALVEVPLMWSFPWLAARFGAERLLLAGAVLFAVRCIGVAVLRDPLLVVSLMLAHGAAFALFVVGGVTYVSRRAPAGAAATAQGVYTSTWMGLAMIVGSGLGGQVAGAGGIPMLYGVAAATALVGVIAVALATRSVPAPRPADQPSSVVSSS
jgi:MFS transporter, PPP family, 3-phenylpropionic acid transporter